MKSSVPLILFLLALVALLAVGWVNYINLNEAYGSGPPYYGRTTNMDKWASPLPVLLPLDAVTFGVLVGLIALMRKRRRHTPGNR